MPIRKANPEPPFNIIRASHVAFDVSDLDRSRAFYVDCLGYLISDADSNAIYLRAVEERNHHSIVLLKADNAAVPVIGFKVSSEEDLDRAAFWFAHKEYPTSFPERPYQGRTLCTCDMFGMPLEFYYRMDQRNCMLRNYAEYKCARIQRIDHINCFTPDVQASFDFCSELGFWLTEYTETDGGNSQLWAVWMHRKGNVHELAFTNGRGPRLHHIGVWTASALDILYICDVMDSSGFVANMERGPGRHGISNAFFLCVRDPDNHRVELFTSDYLTVDPDHEPLRWSLRDPQRQTLWGHQAPASWFEEGSFFSDVRPRQPVLQEQPIVAR
ncbi:MAG: 3,4-dihydroxyphenylacetate 2,3-dioxygenase [Pseudorhodoplanes sp.]|uniref:3,4-dihydroxyphenylacetate 2,3-dioxygenase n=1 Tax=Pseudorhodoplanes sp. TaxID=1934341 RepID=UPI003D0EDA1E